jgi:nitrite reductase (NADH) small subunit
MNEWIRIAGLEDIPRLGARVVRTANGDIALFRTEDDQVFAVNDRCPHKGGPLSQGIVAGNTVTCPLHGWKIQLDSGEAVAPDVGCVGRHGVKVEGGVVYLAASAARAMGVAVQVACRA